MSSYKRPSHRFAFIWILVVGLTLFLLGTRTAPAQSAPEEGVAKTSTEETAPAPPAAMEATPLPPTAPVSQPAAPAVAEKQDNWWKTTLGGLIQLVLLIVAGIAAPLGVLLVRFLARKAKISNADQILALEKLYQLAVEIGISFATQQANKLNNNPDAKSQRIKWASDKAAEMIKEWGLPEKAGKWIADRIEAKLGEVNGPKPVKADPVEKKPE